MTAGSCEWCDLLATGRFLYRETAFAVFAPSIQQAEGHVTLVPATHVSVLAELERETMAAVLAGLSKLAKGLRRAYAVEEVDVVAHSAHDSASHLYFHLVTRRDVTEPSGTKKEIDMRRMVSESLVRQGQ